MIPFILSQEQHGERKATILDRNSSGKWPSGVGYPSFQKTQNPRKSVRIYLLHTTLDLRALKKLRMTKKAMISGVNEILNKK